MTAARPEKNPEAMSGGAIQGSGSSAGYCWSDPWQGTEEEAFMHQPEPAARSYVSRMRSVRQAVVRFGAIACTFEEISRAKFFATKPWNSTWRLYRVRLQRSRWFPTLRSARGHVYVVQAPRVCLL